MAAALGFAVVAVVHRRVGLPLERIASTLRTASDGAFEGAAPQSSIREVDEIASAFNQMSGRSRNLQTASSIGRSMIR
ncbi:MAG: HAMP domain-containing protein [Dehalococcoidia bacterium]|nr:HAMP domain-containing protein [Dehalococcoidia bacterium]